MPKLPLGPHMRPSSEPPSDAGPGVTPRQTAGLQRLDRLDQRIGTESHALSYWRERTNALNDATQNLNSLDTGFFPAFRAQTQQIASKTIAKSPESVRSGLQEKIFGVTEVLEDRVTAKEAELRTVDRRMKIREIVDQYAEIVREDTSQLNAVLARSLKFVDGLELPNDRLENIRNHVLDLLGNAALDAQLEDPMDAQALLSEGAFDHLLTAKSKAVRLAELDDLVLRQGLTVKEKTLAALQQQAEQGGLSEEDVARAVSTGAIAGGDATRLLQLNSATREVAERKKARLDRMLSSNGPLDPTNAEDQEAVDELWKIVFGTTAADPDEQFAAEMRFVKRHGVVPKALLNKYMGALYDTDPVLQLAGARAIKALAELDTRLIDSVPPELKDRAQAINKFSKYTAAPERVVELAEGDLAKGAPTSSPDDAQNTAVGVVEGTDPSEGVIEEDEQPGEDSGATRTVRTSQDFIALLEDLSALPGEEMERHARAAGFSPDLMRLALDLVSASDAGEASRGEILGRVRDAIKGLTDNPFVPKEKLRRLVDSLGPVLGDRSKTLQAIASHWRDFRDLFPGRQDFDKQFRDRRAGLEANTDFTARLEAELSPAEGGLAPNDPRADIPEELPVESGAQRPTKSPRIAFFRKGSDSPFMTLPFDAGMILMRDHERVKERLTFVEQWRSGALKGKALDNRAKDFLGDGEDFKAFVVADVSLLNAKHKNALLAAFIPILIPEITAEPNVWVQLLGDVLPLFGEMEAIRQASKDFEKMKSAVEAGDMPKAIGFGLLTTLSAAGAIPIFGSLFRISRSLTLTAMRNPEVARALRDTKGVKVIHSRLTLARRLDDRFPKNINELRNATRTATVQDIFGNAYAGLKRKQRRLLRGLTPNMKGQSGELEIIQLFKNAGFSNVDEGKFRTVLVKEIVEKGGKKVIKWKERRFDAVSSDGFDLMGNTFVLPRPDGKGTLFEIKVDTGQLTGPQATRNAKIEADIADGIEVRTGPEIPYLRNSENELSVVVEGIRLMRQPLFKVPFDVFTDRVEKLLLPHTRRGAGQKRSTLSKKDVENLVKAAATWHKQARKEKLNPIDVGDAIVLLALMARQLADERSTSAAFELSDEQQREINRRTGKGVDESLNQPIGS